MNKLMNKAFLLMCALVMLMAVQAQAHAQAKPGGNSLEIYPHHAAPEDMSLSEQALHRRATEIAIWSMPLMKYTLTMPANVPVKQFWALTAYDLKTAAFIREMPSAGISSLDKALQVNSDGTVDIYIGPKPPNGKEGNWVPTAEGKNYFVYVRLYGANDPIFTKTFQLNDLEVVE